MTETYYRFFAELTGQGENAWEAWNEAVSSLAEEPGNPPVFHKIDKICEECNTELAPKTAFVTGCGVTLCELDYNAHMQNCSLCGIEP